VQRATRAAPREDRFLRSALTESNPFTSTDEAIAWLSSTGADRRLIVEPAPLWDLGEWSFEATSGNLVHRSGKFFRVEGIHVTASLDTVREWDQPIVDQPEIGILGIIARELDGQLYLLMQAKMEPGNPRGVQLVPTVQATRSNYTQVHQGARPSYVDYFLDREQATVLVDQLQFEQGSTFLRKRNRNIVVEVHDDIPVEEGYRWLTLGQVKKLLAVPNLVSMDTRTVVSCIPLRARGHRDSRIPGNPDGDGIAGKHGLAGFQAEVLASLVEHGQAVHTDAELMSWLTERKCRWQLEVERVGLKNLQGWRQEKGEIVHGGGRFFRVMGVRVEADSREVVRWAQPLVASTGQGLIAFLARKINGVLHVLVQSKVEPGNPDIVAIGPSVQCALGPETLSDPESWPPFADLALHPPAGAVRYSCSQSEEGGRFYRVMNDYRIVELEAEQDLPLPSSYLWVTLRQLHDALCYGLVNVEARSLLSCLSFT
jgi:oxidase EvaA